MQSACATGVRLEFRPVVSCSSSVPCPAETRLAMATGEGCQTEPRLEAEMPRQQAAAINEQKHLGKQGDILCILEFKVLIGFHFVSKTLKQCVNL